MLVAEIVETAFRTVAQHAVGAQVSEKVSPKPATLGPGRVSMIMIMTDGGAARPTVLLERCVVTGGLSGVLLVTLHRGFFSARGARECEGGPVGRSNQT